MAEHAPAPIEIRAFQANDRNDVLALAPRLAEWVATWRDPIAVRSATEGWIRASIDSATQPGHVVYVAAGSDRVVGVVTVSERTHFTGQVDAYVGELAVAPDMERHGIATRLMEAAETWAAKRGRAFLSLETGSANQPARRLYAALGYREEDVRLTKAVLPLS